MALTLSSCSQPDAVSPEGADGQGRESSSIISADNFEANSLTNTWTPTLLNPSNLNLSKEQSRSGGKSVKFSWKPSQYDGTNISCHTELAGDLLPQQEQERWYGFSMFMPASTMKDDNQLTNIMQWLDRPDPGYEGTYPPISLELQPDNTLKLAYRSSNKPIVKFLQLPTSQKEINMGATAFDRWVDYVMYVKWDASGKTGVLQIWQDGVLKVNEQNISIGYEKTRPFWKFGLYSWTGKSSHAERTIYYDDIRVGGAGASYDAVKPGRSTGSAREMVR